MKSYFGLKGSRLRYAIWMEACFAVMIFGYNSASAGGVLGLPGFNKQFPAMDTTNVPEDRRQHNSTIQGTVVALFTLLGAFGALSCISFGDRLGRKRTIFIASAIQAVGAILQASSFQLAQFIVARIILGLGTGGLVATISLWQSELVKAESRGRHVSAFGIFAGMGTSAALWISFGISFAPESSVKWRFPLAFTTLLSVVVCGFIFHLPESPRWLCKVDRIEEARGVLAALYDEDTHSESVDQIMRDILLSLQMSENKSLQSLLDMKPQRNLQRLILAATVQMLLQLTGINAITYYAPTIYSKQLGFPPRQAFVLAAASQAVFIIGSFVCAYTVDRFGRRKLLLSSSIGLTICMACLTGVVSNPNNDAALRSGVFFLYLFYFVASLGYLGLPFLYASELAPVHLRAPVCGISTATSWFFNFLVAEITPVAIESIGYRYFILWCATNAAAIPIVYFFFPETAGRSLEEIEEIFRSSKTVLEAVHLSRTMPRLSLSVLHEAAKETMDISPKSDELE
ncbi:putative MFS sugar transporter [Aspergillus nomiae NRRL 13137]|uniref:Putative MFS sugar transporter n=1 Tax=Aspergillus nomiae NRRL (strain ATCC 15546 / NRRL 13137 / CBS 260.88 / M93) TaxID=1509407 RepID=A0A0L1IMK3_ASPN3|nr:putative MFS sugar transporter [Aspergillus nomiae NRRL 13137]KNG80717.1 putative MFS sugar transporter [Aspergillus nomiae NRRL 13137]